MRLIGALGAFVSMQAVADTASAEAPVATAPDSALQGLWNREDGRGGVLILPCGDAFCGDIAWLRDASGPGQVGERVLIDLRPTADDTWAGTARNPEDGRDYSGTLVLDGDRLVTKGCIFGGLICQTVILTRALAPRPNAASRN